MRRRWSYAALGLPAALLLVSGTLLADPLTADTATAGNADGTAADGNAAHGNPKGTGLALAGTQPAPAMMMVEIDRQARASRSEERARLDWAVGAEATPRRVAQAELAQAEPDHPTTPPQPAPAPPPAWVAPVVAPLTSDFGSRWGRLHAGIDLGAAQGAPVVAASSGLVVVAAREGGYGNVVRIVHPDGTMTVYAHLSEISVGPGPVSAGQGIGRVGSTGASTGPHLHFEVRSAGVTPIDPLPWLNERGVRY